MACCHYMALLHCVLFIQWHCCVANFVAQLCGSNIQSIWKAFILLFLCCPMWYFSFLQCVWQLWQWPSSYQCGRRHWHCDNNLNVILGLPTIPPCLIYLLIHSACVAFLVPCVAACVSFPACDDTTSTCVFVDLMEGWREMMYVYYSLVSLYCHAYAQQANTSFFPQHNLAKTILLLFMCMKRKRKIIHCHIINNVSSIINNINIYLRDDCQLCHCPLMPTPSINENVWKETLCVLLDDLMEFLPTFPYLVTDDFF